MNSEPPVAAGDPAALEGMMSQAAPADQAPAPDPMGNEDCVPLSALNMPDESEQMTSPEVGDQVQYTVEGKVSRIEGDQAYVSRTSINGEPMAAKPQDMNPAQPDAGEPDADEGARLEDLQNQAKGMTL